MQRLQFKPLPIPKSVLEHLLRDRFKHVSEDGRYYILSTNIVAPDGITRVKWSKYSADETLGEAQTGEQELEYDAPIEEFLRMIDSEHWERIGCDVVVSK